MSGGVGDKVSSWLRRGGFLVGEPAARPPGASWALEVYGGPQSRVKLLAVGFDERSVLTMTIAIAFSEPHRRELGKLSPEERVAFSSDMLLSILGLCPQCRVGVRPSPDNPEALVAERLIAYEDLTPATVIDTATTLINVFLAVNAMLWKRFPRASLQQAEQRRGEAPSFL